MMFSSCARCSRALACALVWICASDVWAGEEKAPVKADEKRPPPAKVNPFRTARAAAVKSSLSAWRRKRPDAVPGEIFLSNGKLVKGFVYLTRGRALRLFDEKGKACTEFRLKDLKEFRTNVVEERIEKVWRWKEGGSDVKLFTGKTYPRRDYNFTVTPKRGKPMTGNLAYGTPIYMRLEDGSKKRFLLQPYKKGEVGSTLKDLVYLKRAVLAPQKALTGPRKDEAAAKRRAKGTGEVPAKKDKHKGEAL